MVTMRELRLRRLWSQQELADRAGVAVRTIVNLENGQRRPRLSTMRRLAEVLEVEWTEVDEFRQAIEGKVAA